MDLEELQKQAQEKLAAANRLLNEAAALAEQGGFSITFHAPGKTYYPSSYGKPSDQEVMDALAENHSQDEIASWTAEEFEEMKEEVRQDLTDDWLPEYAERGDWWVPSRNC